MPVVIKLKRKKRTKEWYFIYLSDGREILSYIDFIIKFNIKIGKHLTEENIQEIKSSSDLLLAKEIAYKFLSYRPRTQKEVEEKLKLKGFPDDVVSKVINDIKRYGFINDLEYTKNFILNKMRSKTLGKIALKQILLSKGILNETIDQVLAERENLIDEFEMALELAEKKLNQIKSSKRKKMNKNEQKRKIYEFLTRRGFTWDTINRVINTIFNDLENY